MNISSSFEDSPCGSSSIRSPQGNSLEVVVVGPNVGKRSVEAASGPIPALKVGVDIGSGDDGLKGGAVHAAPTGISSVIGQSVGAGGCISSISVADLAGDGRVGTVLAVGRDPAVGCEGGIAAGPT